MTSNERPIHKERVVVLLKPDAVQRSLIGEIISRFERVGLKFTGLKMVVPTRDQVLRHYNKTDEWFLKKGTRIVEDLKASNLPVDKEPIEYGREIIEHMVKYMTAGPVIAVVLEGNAACAVAAKLTGSTEPTTSDVGTIRGDLTLDSYTLSSVESRGVRNLVHCSGNAEEAEYEIGVWFGKDELVNYRLVQEAILYDVNLDGILE